MCTGTVDERLGSDGVSDAQPVTISEHAIAALARVVRNRCRNSIMCHFVRWRTGGLHNGHGQWSFAAFSTVVSVAAAVSCLQPAV